MGQEEEDMLYLVGAESGTGDCPAELTMCWDGTLPGPGMKIGARVTGQDQFL